MRGASPKLIKPQRPPFANSTVDAYKTQGQITRLLKDYGVEKIQWTDIDQNLSLSFIADVEIDGKPRAVGIKLNPPLFIAKRRTWDPATGSKLTEAPNLSQSMRLLYHYLKSKLAAVAYGFKPFEEEFLADVAVKGPHGEQRLIEVVKQQAPRLLGLPDKSDESIISEQE